MVGRGRGGRRKVGPSRPASGEHSAEAVADSANAQGQAAQASSAVPPAVPQPGLPPVSMEAMQQMMAWWTQFMAQQQPGVGVPQMPPPVPPPMPPQVPPPQQPAEIPSRAPEQHPMVGISRFIKEARNLGCKTFDGRGTVTEARTWMRRVAQTFQDMELADDMRLKVVARLLEGDASTWWETVREHHPGHMPWVDFIQEFNEQYYTKYDRDQKKAAFYALTQGGKSVQEFETELRELATYVPEYVADEENLCVRFETGLHLAIRERMTIIPSMTFKQIVQSAKRAEGIVKERGKVWEERNKKRKGGDSSSQQSKRSRDSSTPRGTGGAAVSAVSGQSSRPRGQSNVQTTSLASQERPPRPDRCRNCRKVHPGKCWEPQRCFQCGETGHMRRECPQLAGVSAREGASSVHSGRHRGEAARGGTPSSGSVQRTGVGSSTPPVGQQRSTSRAQARVFAMTEEDARANPDTVTGTVPNTHHHVVIFLYAI